MRQDDKERDGAKRNEVADAVETQRAACERLGSAQYARLLDDLGRDLAHRGAVGELLVAHADRPLHDAQPLRLLGALHRLALTGRAPRLAARFPSCGGDGEPVDFADVATLVESERDTVVAALAEQVQTNEVGRSTVLLSLAHWLPVLGIRDYSLLEIGSSAGLNLSFDHFGARTSLGPMGDSESTVIFEEDWFVEPPPLVASPARCVSRVGSDLAPISLADDEQSMRLQSFVWPDQTDRRRRLLAAIDITRRLDHTVERAGADEFLGRRLASPLDRPTVVFHSIVWQYLSPTVRHGVRSLIAEAGSRAHRERPLVWARMEPAGAMADVRVTVMHEASTIEFVVAEVGYHGRDFRWL